MQKNLSNISSAAAFDNEGLSFEEESKLSKMILAGEKAKMILRDGNPLTDREAASLNSAVEAGEAAVEQLVLANLPRARKFAAETFRKNPFGINSLEDYEQTALKAICAAARSFDWRKGCRFGTYVHQFLRNEMVRENARVGYALRIPEDSLVRVSALKRAVQAGKKAEAAEAAGMSEDAADKLLSACSVSRSLQDPVSTEEDDLEFGELLADSDAVSAEQIEERIVRGEMLMKLREALSALPEEERKLLLARAGVTGKPQPLKAFVGRYGKSTSGVQKKQIAAEKHLREIYFSLPSAG